MQTESLKDRIWNETESKTRNAVFRRTRSLVRQAALENLTFIITRRIYWIEIKEEVRKTVGYEDWDLS